MERIKDTVSQFMRQLQDKTERAAKDNPEILLKKNLSKKELSHVKIAYFRKGALGIAVDSSAWLYHLSMKKENLLAQLRNDSPHIKELRFKIGAIEHTTDYEKEKRRKGK
jgi:hypothetical protein